MGGAFIPLGRVSDALILIGQNTISIYILQKFTLEYAFKFGHLQLSPSMAYLLVFPVCCVECWLCMVVSKKMVKFQLTRILIGKYA